MVLKGVCLRRAPGDPHANPEGYVPFGHLVDYAGGRSNGCTSWSAANAAEIRAIAAREGAGGLVVGLPLGLDGSFGPAAQAAKDWAMAVSEATGLPAALWDERLSSSAVNRMLIGEADLSRAKRAKAVDAAAAAYTLQSALDATRPPPAP